MKHLSTYNVTDNEWIFYNSKLCSVACSLGHAIQSRELEGRINELCQSFFNQWQFVIDSYNKLYKLLNILNNYSDKHMEGRNISEYVLKSIESEDEFKNYSYILIVSIKTYLDLFVCLVDIIQNPMNTNERMTDFNKFWKKDGSIIRKVFEEFQRLSNTEKNWVDEIIEIRNKIIHRGFHLKPLFGFNKSEELTIQACKGADKRNIEIGMLFNGFMSCMPIVEERISNF